ncbi:MAG: hypothetical protein HKO64_00700 [Xanthomonadales bacterium]|nr:hypothetical protein [Xanthomonadales bacterium]NNL94115.1 hypothetical protein [Xanthomonadales bacterium]
MDLSFDAPGNHHFIRSISEEGIRIGDEYLTTSFLVSASELRRDWPPQSHEELDEGHLDTIFELQPDVVLIGTGAKQHFLPQSSVFRFYRQNVGIEVMNTEAACRTFNVLVNEGRKVVAALMPVRTA